MKILLCNKFYYRRGGDCIYTMNLEQMLKAHGHDVAIFAQQFPLNDPSPWSKYWPTEFKMKPSLTMLDSLLRPFGLGSVKRCFNAIMDDFFGRYTGQANQYQDCVVHLNNIHTQLSPILAEMAHERGIRVVWTLHDSKLVCPCYTCMRDGKWCEECFTDKKAVLRHKCMTGGTLGSFIGYQEAMKWTAERLQKCVDVFICPSQFMADTMMKGGFLPEKLYVKSNYIDIQKVQKPSFEKDDYYVYLGQMNPIKGVRTLCEAASQLPHRLVMIGGGFILDELKVKYAKAKNIEFKGQMTWEALRPLVEKARFMVLPSECSENNPLSVIESLSLGTPVLGANIGGIPELLNKNNGMKFESGNTKDLADAISQMWNKRFDYSQIASSAISLFSENNYYEFLLSQYKNEK